MLASLVYKPLWRRSVQGEAKNISFLSNDISIFLVKGKQHRSTYLIKITAFVIGIYVQFTYSNDFIFKVRFMR